MEFVLTDVRQVDNIRWFYFDAVAENRSRQQVTVGADLDLIRKYRIPLQELPLLCRRLLEARTKIEAIMFTEGDMVRYADDRAAEVKAAMEKRRPRRPPGSSRAGEAWRSSPAPKGEK